MSRRFASSLTFALALASVAPATTTGAEDPQIRPAEARPEGRVNINGTEVFHSDQKGDPEPSHLLMSRAVQREIGLANDQAEKIDSIIRRDGGLSWPVLLEVRRARDPSKKAEAWSRLTEMRSKSDDEIRAVLNRTQARRLREIVVQNLGLRALLMPEVADELRLSPEQREALRVALPPLAPMGLSYRNADAKAELARAEVERLLTEEQRGGMHRLRGAAFDPGRHLRLGDPENPNAHCASGRWVFSDVRMCI